MSKGLFYGRDGLFHLIIHVNIPLSTGSCILLAMQEVLSDTQIGHWIHHHHKNIDCTIFRTGYFGKDGGRMISTKH